MLLDGLAVFGLSVLSMVVREGAPPWPTYTLSAYLLSFTRLDADLPGRLLLRWALRARAPPRRGGGPAQGRPALAGRRQLRRPAQPRAERSAPPAGFADRPCPAVPHPQPGRGDRPRRCRRRHQPRHRPRPAHPARGSAPSGARGGRGRPRPRPAPPRGQRLRARRRRRGRRPPGGRGGGQGVRGQRRAARDGGVARRVVPPHDRSPRPAQRHHPAAGHRARDALRARPAARGRWPAVRAPAPADDVDLAAALQAAARPVPPPAHRSGLGDAARRGCPVPARGGGPPAALPAGARRGGWRDLRDGQVPHHAHRRRVRRRGPALDPG